MNSIMNLYILLSRQMHITNGSDIEVNVTGTLEYIRDYAEVTSKCNKDEMKAFELIVSPALQKRSHHYVVKKLKDIHNDRKQLICFLSGPGGTGKSKVVNAAIEYCQKLCAEINMKFTKRTIDVTALTGAAAVSIFGETTYTACYLNGRVNAQHVDEWSYTSLVIIDKISFSSEGTLKKINKNLNQLRQVSNEEKYWGFSIFY